VKPGQWESDPGFWTKSGGNLVNIKAQILRSVNQEIPDFF
jgi:hypothetical protein